MKFGLIGKTLSHSFSNEYHNDRFRSEHIDAEYYNYELQRIEDINDLLASDPSLIGLNVTAPYKQSVISFLSQISDDAKSVGAVNTIVVEPDGLVGYNTDIVGFQESLDQWIDKDIRQALVLGTGGSSNAVTRALKLLDIEYLLVSRTRGQNKISYEDLTEEVMKSHKLIINTTPLGMYPDVKSMAPIPTTYITSEHWVYDLVYNPEKTILLMLSEESGAQVKNGLQMLHLQADKSWNIWKSYLEKEHGSTFDQGRS